MTATPLPFCLPGCCVDTIQQEGETLLILAHADQMNASCPQCGQPSMSIHSYYSRSPTDLPVSDQAVRLVLRVRRFRCHNPDCPKHTFAERLPDLLPARARRTLRLEKAQCAVAFALGGQAGARLLHLLHMPASPDILLRMMRRHQVIPAATPRVLGVDDWAYCKGKRYGTILVDLERHQVIDLLEDRTADTLANWLRLRSGVEVIARDRSTEYARGANEAAPRALQVADRWHLLHNVHEMLERFLRRIHGRLTALPTLAVAGDLSTQRRAFPRTKAEIAASRASRARRLAVYKRVQQLREQGQNISQIARALNMSRGGVRTFYYAESFPERARHAVAPSVLDPYMPYLEARLAEGCENASQLWREICQQGFPGTRRQVLKWMQPRRSRPAPTTPGHYRRPRLSPLGLEQTSEPEAKVQEPTVESTPRSELPSSKQLAWLMVRAPEALDADKQSILQQILQDADVHAVYDLVRQFVQMVRQQEVAQLDPWLDGCAASEVENLRTFAGGIKQDYAAVRAALETKWSNAQAEGQVNRLKLLKRQMYGRAGFDLLRLRLLHAP